MNGIYEDYPNPPSANPANYCRFCFSQLRIQPLFTVDCTDQNQKLTARIESLVQIRLDLNQDGTSAICNKCQQKLDELELFRNRCQKLHEAVRRCRPFPTLELQLTEVQNGDSLCDYNRLYVLIEPLILSDYGLELGRLEEGSEPEGETALNETCKSLNATELSIVVHYNDIKKNDRFWKALTRDVGSIPNHIRHALELTGRCREASLGVMSPSTVKRIEESMRQSAQLLADQEELRGTDRKQAMVKYYGKAHWDHPERFCFSAEETCTILSIASAIQQRGIRHYLKAANVEPKEVREKVENGPELAKLLANKIREYYQARESTSENFKAFFKKLPKSQQCRVYRNPAGKVLGAIRCLICLKSYKVTLTGAKGWCIKNFVSHCERSHYQVEVAPVSGPGRRRSFTPKPERTAASSPTKVTEAMGLSIMGEEEEDEL